MADKNVTLHQKNGSGTYDNLYPNITNANLPSPLIVNSNPTSSMGVATKDYVDNGHIFRKELINTTYVNSNGNFILIPDNYFNYNPCIIIFNMNGSFVTGTGNTGGTSSYFAWGTGANINSSQIMSFSGLGTNYTLSNKNFCFVITDYSGNYSGGEGRLNIGYGYCSASRMQSINIVIKTYFIYLN